MAGFSRPKQIVKRRIVNFKFKQTPNHERTEESHKGDARKSSFFFAREIYG